MGEAELEQNQLTIYSQLCIYGNAADPAITAAIREEIETMWNEPVALITLGNKRMPVIFRIAASFHPDLVPEDIFENTDPRKNYFRVEKFAVGNISFVDGLGCNSGYFLLENLYKGSTTAAHEYGHTLGLPHPRDLDIRGQGVPGIMYPRGTLVDPEYQYNPQGRAGDSNNGGTMYPIYRKVRQQDIDLLKLNKLDFKNRKAIVGEFSSIWHPDHAADTSGNQ
jgi:hypothetical protein